MGDKVVWFEDCPSCGAKGSLECFEHDSAELKLDSCDKCGFIQSYEYTEKKGVIHVEKVT